VQHIQAFTTEIDYTLKKIGVEDEKLHAYMKWILHHTRRLQHLSAYSPESAAHHSDLLLEILAARDHRSGFYKTDPIEQMINSI
jgi:methylaspartate ammonia-lyase